MLAGLAHRADADVHRRKVATALSAIGVGVSSGIVVTSFFVGPLGHVDMTVLDVGLATSIVTPSLGEFYAHQVFTIGEALRVAGAALALVGVNQTESVSCENGFTTGCTTITGAGVALLGIGAIAFIGGAAYDVLDAGDAVDRHDLRVSVVPMAVPAGGGVAIAGRW